MLTFDCFGTLVDWRHGIRTSAELLFPSHGQAVLDAYSKHESQVEGEVPFRRYRYVLAESFRRAATELDLHLTPDDENVLEASLPYWPVFSDVGLALSTLRADSWRLAILTNCDRDLIAETCRRLPAEFDIVVTAEDVESYKPGLAHFRRFESIVGASAEAWIHVAQSYFHDISPASQMDVSRIWINRQRESNDPTIADAVLTSLSELPAAVSDLCYARGRPRRA